MKVIPEEWDLDTLLKAYADYGRQAKVARS